MCIQFLVGGIKFVKHVKETDLNYVFVAIKKVHICGYISHGQLYD